MNQIIEMIAVLRQGLQGLADPSSNPVAAVFMLALVVLSLLLIVLLVVFTLTLFGGGKQEPVEPARKPQGPAEARRRLTIQAAVAMALLIGIAYAWSYSASDAMCARCHFTERAVESHAAGSHAGASCASCHVAPGVDGQILARVRGLENAVKVISGDVAVGPVSANVSNRSCLSCHKGIQAGVTLARSVRMRHAESLQIGHACIDCHNTEGHGTKVRKPAYPKMSMCVVCHDGKTARAECETCHSKDVGVAVRRLKRPFAQITTSREDCRGCHSIAPCNACHGLELPHSKLFVEGFHARQALLEPAVCIRCHDVKAFCNVCHRFNVTVEGVKSWTRTHSNVGPFVAWHSRTPAVGLGSCLCHDENRQRFCNYCHGPQPER